MDPDLATAGALSTSPLSQPVVDINEQITSTSSSRYVTE